MRKLSIILSIIINTSIIGLEPTNTSGMYFPPIKTPTVLNCLPIANQNKKI